MPTSVRLADSITNLYQLRFAAVRTSDRSRLLRLLLVCASFLFICRVTLAAEQGAVQVEVSPPTLQLAPGDSADVVLVVKNSLSTAVDTIQLQCYTDTGLTVTPEKLNIKSLAPGGIVGWSVHLDTQKPGRTLGALQFWLRYSRLVDGVRVPGVAVTSLTLQERTPLAIDKLVDGKLESAVDQLNEKRPAWMYLIITNRAAIPVTITSLKAYKPKFILFCAPSSDAGPCLPDKKSESFQKQLLLLTQSPVDIHLKSDSLPPQSSRVVPLEAEATDEARAGNERVVFEVGLTWTDAGRNESGSVLVAQAVPVGVFGESDILKLLGVPSFFMLPGFLALTTFGALWTRVAPKKKPESSLTVAEFGLASVTLSLLAMLVYPRFTHRDYLQGYGLRDVMLVWFGSVMVGLFAWIFVAGGIKVYDRYRRHTQERERRKEEGRRQREEADRKKEEERRTPTSKDGPLEILGKLKLNSIEFPLQQVEVRVGGKPGRCFVILPPGQGRLHTWVAPPASLTPQGATKLSRQELADELSQRGVLDSRDELTRVLKGAEQAGWITTWAETSGISGPTALDAAEFNPVDNVKGFMFVDIGLQKDAAPVGPL